MILRDGRLNGPDIVPGAMDKVPGERQGPRGQRDFSAKEGGEARNRRRDPFSAMRGHNVYARRRLARFTRSMRCL